MSVLESHCLRGCFPALNDDMVFMDNAGGSQVLKSVADSVSDYLLNSNVQLGASYRTSQAASKRVEEGVSAMQDWIHAEHLQEVVVSTSTTMALRLLSLCLSHRWQKGDEVIVTNSDHEANRSPWLDLQSQGIVIKEWKLNPDTYLLDTEDLRGLITEKTRLLAFPHVSNVLGSINDIEKIISIAHECNVLTCVDGVAYAPHRRIDVQKWDVDFYVFSTYKTFGPHLAVLYGKKHLLESLPGINHRFITTTPYKLQPGNVNYELTASLVELPKYIESLSSESSLQAGFDKISEHEQILMQRLLQFLTSYKEVQIIGESQADQSKRVATLSFVHKNMSSEEIVAKVDAYDIGIRFGDFYAVKLIDDLGLRPKNGVVRVSLVHYNTLEEVSQLINALRTIF